LADPQDDLERIRERLAVGRAQAGDREAFSRLVASYHDRLTYYAHRLTGNAEAARDILQDTWLEVFRTLSKLHSTSAFRVWLYKIAHHRSLTYLRRHQVESRAIELRAQQLAGCDEAVDGWNEMDLLDNAELVHRALDRLSNVHREVMALRFLENMDVRDIARVTNVSEGTAKSRLHYAKRAMRQIIDEEQGRG
jgi:RNA polymerase sigma-70 factor, ECF subfamily